MLDPELLERITARRAELDELEEKLAKHLAEVRAERDELTVAERVLERMSEQRADARASVPPAPGQVGGRAVMLIPHRTSGVEETTLPPDHQRILAAVRRAAGPVMARQVGDALGIDVSVRGKLEPLRGKLVRLVDRGWLRKLPDGAFTQVTEGKAVSAKSLQPGDLIFSRGSAARPEHVGMYIGSGLTIEAPRTGKPVRITPLADWDILAARRVLQPPPGPPSAVTGTAPTRHLSGNAHRSGHRDSPPRLTP